MDESRVRELAVAWTKAQPVVRVFLRSVVRRADVADDLLQQVAVTAVEKYPEYDVSRSFSAWVIGIARHKAMNYIRTSSRDRHHFDSELLAMVADAHEELAPELSEREEALRKCLQKLSGKASYVIEMRYLDGTSSSQIARQLGMTSNAVSALLRRIRMILADCITRRLSLTGSE
jgi:RNA polymerase sigma-70 factor (ECF subfamily)